MGKGLSLGSPARGDAGWVGALPAHGLGGQPGGPWAVGWPVPPGGVSDDPRPGCSTHGGGSAAPWGSQGMGRGRGGAWVGQGRGQSSAGEGLLPLARSRDPPPAPLKSASHDVTPAATLEGGEGGACARARRSRPAEPAGSLKGAARWRREQVTGVPGRGLLRAGGRAVPPGAAASAGLRLRSVPPGLSASPLPPPSGCPHIPITPRAVRVPPRVVPIIPRAVPIVPPVRPPPRGSAPRPAGRSVRRDRDRDRGGSVAAVLPVAAMGRVCPPWGEGAGSHASPLPGGGFWSVPGVPCLFCPEKSRSPRPG